ncbi:unnamed protein product [Lactuca saligna]|uniref:Alcohol dehydrogenase-like N-terminal domain-containing protein n=1 Tax=Lactuca saligna TaxID=75948 RepID=A0AA35Z5R0_LACSI|nr:unnamed protein product [Lactuca saligna]
MGIDELSRYSRYAFFHLSRFDFPLRFPKTYAFLQHRSSTFFYKHHCKNFNLHVDECSHEIVGVVTELGSKVEKFEVGDNGGVGCLVGSYGSCNNCANDFECYCPKQILTYASPYHDGTKTYGGYSDHIVADERFVLRWPENLPLNTGAPLLCVRITTYSPLCGRITTYSPLGYFRLDKPGMKVGVVGLGGLGHVAVKMVKAFGAEVIVFSTKGQEALQGLKADCFIVSKDQDQMQLLLVGAPEKPLQLISFSLITGRKIVGGSTIGGLKETQEMLDFAASMVWLLI